MNLAVVDMGSNSMHLQVVSPAGETLHVARASVRLGDLDHGRLRPTAMDAATQALSGFQDQSRAHGAQLRQISATAALRDCSNPGDLAQRLGTLNLRLEVLSGNDEAGLIFLGACAALNLESALVIDLGGRSTEFALGRKGELQEVLSLNIGHITASQVPMPERIAWCRERMSGAAAFFARDLPPVVLTAGTSLTVGRMALMASGAILEGDPKHPVHGLQMPRSALEETLSKILRSEDLTLLAGMDERRLDTLHAGALALGCAVEGLITDAFILSRSALREGLVARALQRVLCPVS
ncbi:MAG: exopolyphosphatase/guanosine-5'-triphosphate,3'-diphosphate pyrophosphatase [Cognaticolwellia sp.]|jgi:exopolyphosphatase/guanosine-5'-triphosphate,3'-diphosphate pyrophosphatase